eukprot:scaffold70142_cov57-Phaeocystis_antarctica.AAC.3
MPGHLPATPRVELHAQARPAGMRTVPLPGLFAGLLLAKTPASDSSGLPYALGRGVLELLSCARERRGKPTVRGLYEGPAAVRRHVSAAAAAGLPRGERGTAAVVVGYLHRGVVYKGPLRNGRGTCRCAVLCAAAARHCGGPTALRRGRSPGGPRRQQGVALHARVLRASPLCAGTCYPQMPRAVQHAGAGCGCDDSDVQRAVVLGGGRAAVRGVRAGGTRLHLPQTAEQADRCYVRGKVPRRPAH